MKFTKRALVLLLALCMVTSMVPQPTYAAERPAAISASTTKAAKLKTPALPKLSNVNGGIKITWSKVKGAAKYRIFYKTGNGKWKKLADTTKTSYTWKKAKSGTKYSFTIRCVTKNGKTYTSGYNKKGKAITYIAAPKLKTVQNTGKGIKVAWGKVKGAAKYRIFYKTGNGKWKKLADTTKTSYTWKKAKNGTTYSFTVRCITKNGKKFTSAYNTKGLKIKCVLAKAQEGSASAEKKPESKTDTTEQVAKPKLAAPELYSATAISSSKVKVTWGAVKGASKYRVYYKTGNGNWAKAGDTTGTSYEVTGLKAGTTYVFTVKCLATDSAEASGYNKYGMMAETTAADTTETDTTEGGTSGGSTQPTEPTQPTQPTQEETEAEKKAKEQAAKWKNAYDNLERVNTVWRNWHYSDEGQETYLLLSDEVFYKYEETTGKVGIILAKAINEHKTTGTDAEIAEMDAAAKELQDAWDLAKKPESRAKFDPSKLVYYKTESKKLHEMFNDLRERKDPNVKIPDRFGNEALPTMKWRDQCADYVRVQASYNVIAGTFVTSEKRAPKWTSATHDGGMIGTNDIPSADPTKYAEYAYRAFVNSPPHLSNILAATCGDLRHEYAGVAIVGYEHHGVNNVVCIADLGMIKDPDTFGEDQFDSAWMDRFYQPANDELWFENIESISGVSGVTHDAVKNCAVK